MHEKGTEHITEISFLKTRPDGSATSPTRTADRELHLAQLKGRNVLVCYWLLPILFCRKCVVM